MSTPFKEKFVIILSQLFSCLVYLKSHTAAFSLPEQDSIEELMNVLKKFKTLLYDQNQRYDYNGAAFGLVPHAAIDSKLVLACPLKTCTAVLAEHYSRDIV